MNTRSKKKDTKLASVRWEVSEKEVEVETANNQAVQQENRTDQIEKVDLRQQEEVSNYGLLRRSEERRGRP